MTQLRKCLAVGLLALGACTYWHGDLERIVDQSGRNFAIAPDKVYKDVDLAAVAAYPTNYKFVDIQFQAVVNRLDEKIFVTGYSTFRQEDYVAFSVWPASARLWESDSWVKSIPTLYLRKDNADLQNLISATRYALAHIKGRVMNDFENLPFIDVHYFEVLDPYAYSEETLTDLRGGLAAVADKKPAQSIERLERALEGPLHARARVMAHSQLGRIYEERGDFDKAAKHFEAVLWDDPENVTAWEGWERNVKAEERKRKMPKQ